MPDNQKENIFDRLKNIRQSRKLTIREVANAIGINESNLSAIESGKRNIGDRILSDLAKYYGLPFEELKHDKITKPYHVSGKIYQGVNFKRYLEESRISKTDAAKILNISRQSLYQWFESKQLERETVDKILNTFNESESRIFGEIRENAKPIIAQNASFNEIEENGNEFIDIGNSQYIMVVPLVEEYAYAGFLSGFADKEYIKELPKHTIVVSQLHKGKYFSFKVVGDSMNDNTGDAIAHGDIVTGREIQKSLWTSKFHIHKFMDYIIVHKEGILIKRIISHDVDNGIIKCRSLNPDKEKYPDFEISLAEVSKIMNIVNVTKAR